MTLTYIVYDPEGVQMNKTSRYDFCILRFMFMPGLIILKTIGCKQDMTPDISKQYVLDFFLVMRDPSRRTIPVTMQALRTS